MSGNILHTFLVQGLSTLAHVALILITSRTLGPAGHGTVTLALLTARMVDMAISLGLGHALMYQRAQERWSHAQVASAAYTLWGGLSLLLLLAGGLLFSPLRASLPEGLSPILAGLILGITSLRLLHYFMGSILLGADRIRLYNRLNLLNSLITTVICLLTGLGGWLTVEGVLWAYLAGAFAAAAATAWHVGFRLARTPAALLRECAGYGLKVQLGQTALFLNNRLDAFLVGYFLSVREVGLYAAAVALAEIVWRLPNVVATVLYPTVARSSPADGAQLTRRVCRVTLAVVLLACGGVAAFAGLLVHSLFGPDFGAALLPTLLLLPGMITMTLFTLLYHDLAGRGQPGQGLAATLAGLAVTLGLDLLLIPRMGIAGAALASSVAYTVSALWTLVCFQRENGGAVVSLLWPTRDDWQALRSAIARLSHRHRSRIVKEGSQ